MYFSKVKAWSDGESKTGTSQVGNREYTNVLAVAYPFKFPSWNLITLT